MSRSSYWRKLDRQGWERVADLTLGEAVDLLRDELDGHACACIGPPFCCAYAYWQADALRRAAHITVKLIAELRAQSAATARGEQVDK